MTFEELAKTLGIRNKTLRMAFSRHKLSIGKPADIQSFLTQRFSGKRRHRAARPKQTGKHLEKWRFVKHARIKENSLPAGRQGLRTKISEEIISLQTKVSTTETKLQEKDVRIQQLEGEKLKLEEANASLEKTNQALKMQLSAVESISQAQGKIIESLKKNKSEEAKTSVEKEEAKIVENPPCHSREGGNPEIKIEAETQKIPTEATEEKVKIVAAETPTAAEVFSEIPDERNPEKEKQTEVEAAEISQSTGNETPDAKEVKSEETPTISEAKKAEEVKTETTETEASENSTEEKAASDSPAVETENAVEAEAAETHQEKTETPEEIPAEEKTETETPAEARSETAESPAEVAQ